MKALTVIIAIACTTLLGVGLAHADADRLTPEQRSAKAAFDAELPEDLEELRGACGIAIGVSVDFSKFDQAAWVAAFNELENARRNPGAAPRRPIPAEQVMRRASVMLMCRSVIEAVEQLCRSRTWKPIIGREVTSLACSFEGYQQARAGESHNVHVRQNVDVRGGVITLHVDPRLLGSGNIEENISSVVIAAFASSKGAPPAAAAALQTGENGAPCGSWSQCDSKLCVNKTCRPCASTACQRPGSTCVSTPSGGVCLTAEERRRIREARASSSAQDPAPSAGEARPSKPKGLARGRMCSKSSECTSGVCQMENRTRGRCQ